MSSRQHANSSKSIRHQSGAKGVFFSVLIHKFSLKDVLSVLLIKKQGILLDILRTLCFQEILFYSGIVVDYMHSNTYWLPAAMASEKKQIRGVICQINNLLCFYLGQTFSLSSLSVR